MNNSFYTSVVPVDWNCSLMRVMAGDVNDIRQMATIRNMENSMIEVYALKKW